MSQLRERIHRALLLVPLVAGRPEGIEIGELAGRLGIEPTALAEEIDFLMMVGRPPFSPADFLDIYLEGGRVFADLSLSLDRPPRLSHDEALALAVGAQVVVQNAGATFAAEVEGAVKKLEEAMTKSERERYHTVRDRILAGVASQSGALIDVIRAALEARQPLSIDYFSAHRDERRERTVHPYDLHSRQGHWYLVAAEPGADPKEPKLFRLDRMGAARAEGEPGTVEIPEGLHHGSLEGEPVAKVEVAAAKARFAAEQVAEADCHWQEDGGVEIVFPVASEEWVSSWVLSFAPHAKVLEPESLAQKVRADARRALAAYTET